MSLYPQNLTHTTLLHLDNIFKPLQLSDFNNNNSFNNNKSSTSNSYNRADSRTLLEACQLSLCCHQGLVVYGSWAWYGVEYVSECLINLLIDLIDGAFKLFAILKAKRTDSNTQTARRTSITRSGSATDQRKFVTPFPPPDFMREFANIDSSKSPQKHNLFSIPSSHFSSLSTANILSKPEPKNPELPIPPHIQLETPPFPVPSSSICSEEEAAIPQSSKPVTTDAVGSSKSSSGDTSNSSTDSVIFKPSSCDDSDANDGQPDHITSLRNKKNMNKNDVQKPSHDQQISSRDSAGQSNIPKEKILNDSKILKPLQPISTSMPYAFLRSLSTLSQGKSQGSSDPSERPLSSPSHRSTQSDSFHRTDHHNVAPSFGKLYSPVVMSTTTASTIPYAIDDHLKKFPKQHITPAGGSNSGYLSDGEILRSGTNQDIGSGYLSEGGATLYVRRIQQRFREGLLAVQESLERNQSKADDTRLAEWNNKSVNVVLIQK